MNKKRATARRPSARAEQASVGSPPASAASAPTAKALGQHVLALSECGHPEPFRSRATMVDATETRWPMTWCGVCGAIALTQGDADATLWVRAGLVQALEGQSIAQWTHDMEALALAAAEVTRALHALGRRADGIAKLAAEARRLKEATASLERAVRAALGDV